MQPYVIAGFLIETLADTIKSIRICYSGIEAAFIHATATEEYLNGKPLQSTDVLVKALSILANELSPDENASHTSKDYRKALALALFFKFTSSLMAPEDGVDDWDRGISTGAQDVATLPEKWPMTKDLPSVDGLACAAGEVLFCNDVPLRTNELWAAFVPATAVNARISGIDATEALVKFDLTKLNSK